MLKLLCILRVTSTVKTYQVSLALGNYGQMTQPQYGCDGLSGVGILKSDLDAKLVFWRSPISAVLECRNIKQILR